MNIRLRHIALSLLLAVCCTAFAGIHSYVDNSVLSSGTFYKVQIDETGIYRITYEQLRQMGISNPENVSVWGYGGAMLDQDFTQPKIDDLPQVPVYMYKGSDGVFGSGDYILFFGQGVISWKYTGIRFRHTLNPYSKYGFYFITDSKPNPRRIEQIQGDFDIQDRIIVDTYTNYQVHEYDSINLVDRLYHTAGGGREFYGESFAEGQTRSFSFDFPNIVPAEQGFLYADVASDIKSNSANFAVKVNDESIDINLIKTSNESYVKAFASSDYTRLNNLTNANRQTVKITFTATDISSVGFLNYLEFAAICQLKMNNDFMSVRSAKGYGENRKVVFAVGNAKNSTQVWNVTRLDSIYGVPAKMIDGRLYFEADNSNTVQEFVLLNPSAQLGKQVSIVGKISNQNLHKLKDIDMVFITNEQFLSQAQNLALVHEQHDGLTTAVVTDKQVYNEFSSGTPDATAYRWIMKMLYDRATDDSTINKPRFLLLVGDGTFDNRKLLSSSGNNLLLTYQARNSVSEVEAYASDDYFAYLDDADGSSDVANTLKISVGRLPVNTVDEAEKLVNKLIKFIHDDSYGKWKNQLLFLGDDGDDDMHIRAIDEAAQYVQKNHANFQVNKIYLDAYPQVTNATGESYPMAKTKFDNLLQSGVLFFDYCGHASANSITNESILLAADAEQMTNENLGFWMLATCSFARFDEEKSSAAERALINPAGGSIGILASCRTVFAGQNKELNNLVVKALFKRSDDGRYTNTIGEAISEGKNQYAKTPSLRDKNRLPYLLLGDPAIRLHYPDDYMVKTTYKPDTIHALDMDTIQGYIATHQGDTATDFNGRVQITVFDKLQSVQTLNNDKPTSSVRYTFTEYSNMLFNGEAKVENGKFSLEYLMPKDIKYNYGNGHVIFYAYDTITSEHGNGYYNDFVVGGSSENQLVDTLGPQMNIYLNNRNFSSGDAVNNQPRFMADLYDENGINTIGNGIGHDLLLTIDNSSEQVYSLNNSFVSSLGDYRSGSVSYRLPELTEGKHTLSFRAWDIAGNSTTKSLDFIVENDKKTSIYNVTAYPNPAQVNDIVKIRVEHDQPDQALTVECFIYDFSGHLRYRHVEDSSTEIVLNLADISLQPNTYLYRVIITSNATGSQTAASGRLIVR